MKISYHILSNCHLQTRLPSFFKCACHLLHSTRHPNLHDVAFFCSLQPLLTLRLVVTLRLVLTPWLVFTLRLLHTPTPPHTPAPPHTLTTSYGSKTTSKSTKILSYIPKTYSRSISEKKSTRVRKTQASKVAGIGEKEAKAFTEDEYEDLMEVKNLIRGQAGNDVDSVPYNVVEGGGISLLWGLRRLMIMLRLWRLL